MQACAHQLRTDTLGRASVSSGQHLQLLVRERLADGVDQRDARLLPQGRQRAQQQRQLRGGKAPQLRLRLPVRRLQ